MRKIEKIIEVGGGYGYLMQDFLRNNRDLKASMLDISKFLLQKQQDLLKDYEIDFILDDFLNVDMSFLEGFDMAIFNENLGDFPAALNICTDILEYKLYDMPEDLKRIRKIFDQYDLRKPDMEIFNLNIGAIEAAEKLCSAHIPFIFICEHSCETSAPSAYNQYLQISSTGNPERIALRGHDEYTIKFSYLAEVARYYGYVVIRGQVVDFIEPNFSDKVKVILRSNFTANDEHEIIRQFVNDLYKYEYLILMRKGGTL